jgi:hypothetical protein
MGKSALINFSASAGEVKSGNFTINCDQNRTLSSEYVVIIFNWMVDTAGSNANAGSQFADDDGAEYLTTTILN